MRNWLVLSLLGISVMSCGVGGYDHRIYYLTESVEEPEVELSEPLTPETGDIAIHLDDE